MSDTAAGTVPLLPTDAAHLLERITDGFFALDSAWRIVYMNEEARHLLHARGSDIIGKVWLDEFPRAKGTAFEREYKRAMNEQVPVQFTEYSGTSQRWLEVKAYPSADGISVYFRDVSARMKAERELEARSAQLQAVIGFGRLAVSGVSAEQLVRDAMEMLHIYIDVPIVEFHRFDKESRTLILVEHLGWGDLASQRAELRIESQAGEAIRRNQAIVTADVRLDPRFSSRAAFGEAGVCAGLCVPVGTRDEPIGVISAYTTSPRVFATNEVRFVESTATIVAEAMRTFEQKRRVVEVLETITDAFASLDRDLKVTYVNNRMAKLYGIEAQDAIGRDVIEYLPGPNREEYLQIYQGALKSKVPASYETFNGQLQRWYEARIYPSSDGLSIYLRDVNDRKTRELQMQQLNEELEHRVAERTVQLEHANKELESFAYSVSHDLRAPLRAIDGFSLALQEDYDGVLDGQAKNYLTRVRGAANRMASLIDALLQLAHVARQPIHPQPLDLSKVAAEVVQELRDGEPQRAVQVTVQQDVSAQGEPMLLRAVLQNLIGNAWKFTRNAPQPSIAFGFDGREYFVRDNGAGFDMAYANKLFGAFQRLHSAEEFEGTGIGLATVARIVHRHGGEIRAEGQVGAGATFYFTLPRGESA